MLMMIGPVRFKVAPFSMSETSRKTGGSWVEKPVMGARPLVEFTGDGPEAWSIRARLLPRRFGGEGNLELLGLMRASGLPQYMLRGDGRLMGWVVLTDVSERSSYLDADGVGQVIEVDLSLRRAQRPTMNGYAAGVANLFQGLF